MKAKAGRVAREDEGSREGRNIKGKGVGGRGRKGKRRKKGGKVRVNKQ